MKWTVKKSFFLIFVGIALLSLFPIANNTNIVESNTESPQISSTTNAEYLIITIDEFVDELEPLSLWKNQKRISTDIITLAEIRNQYSGMDDQEKIKSCILDYYTNRGTFWILLAGDHEHIPSRDTFIDEGYAFDGNIVYSDHYYADLDNNWDLDGDSLYMENNGDDEWDYFSEVYVGRLPANSEMEMSMLVNRILNYEKYPPVGEWMETALFAGIVMGYELDLDNNGVLDWPGGDTNRLNNYIVDQIIEDDWTVHLLGETEGLAPSAYFYTEPVNKVNFHNRLEQGSSLMSIFGHSMPQTINRHIWTIDSDGDGLYDPYPIDTVEKINLLNASEDELVMDSAKYCMAFTGGCSSGNFTEDEDCVAEYLLKTVAIGSVGPSQIAWFQDNWTEVEYGGWYADGLNFRFFEQLHNYHQPAQALALAKQDYVIDRDIFGTTEWYPAPQWDEKTLRQFNYFGDPSVEIWMWIPEEIDASWEFRGSGSGYEVTVTADSEILPNAHVTLSNDTDVIWEGQTHSNGMVFPEYDRSYQSGEHLTLTITKHTHLPKIQSIPHATQRNIPGFSSFIILMIAFCSVCIIGKKLKRELRKSQI